jgi:hypothetical protein
MADERVPDVSPFPESMSLGEAFQSLLPPGTDPALVMRSLKSARREPVAIGEIPDEDLRYYRLCPSCDVAHDSRIACGPAHVLPPADPFTAGDQRAATLAQFRSELIGADIPVESADRIIGVMLAEAHGGQPSGE